MNWDLAHLQIVIEILYGIQVNLLAEIMSLPAFMPFFRAKNQVQASYTLALHWGKKMIICSKTQVTMNHNTSEIFLVLFNWSSSSTSSRRRLQLAPPKFKNKVDASFNSQIPCAQFYRKKEKNIKTSAFSTKKKKVYNIVLQNLIQLKRK